MRALRLLASMIAASCTLSPAARAEDRGIELALRHPRPGADVDPSQDAFVAGEAFLRLDADAGVDVVLVIDTSSSAGVDVGVDLDGDGQVTTHFAGPDSVYAAELRAADDSLALFEKSGVRTGLVRFSGMQPRYPGIEPRNGEPVAAVTVSDVTADVAEVRRKLATLAGREPNGMTNFVAALEHALDAFPLLSGKRHRAILFLTDGTATGPYDSPDDNIASTLAVARRAAEKGVQIHTFAIGTGALANPALLMQMSDLTGGFFTPVERVEELVELARRVAATTVAEVTVRNRTTGQAAAHLYVSRDGEFGALVPVRPGANAIGVTARARSGATRSLEFTLYGRAGARAEPVPAALRELEKGALAERLGRLRERTNALREKLRLELALRIQKERERNRKELELRVEKEPGAKP